MRKIFSAISVLLVLILVLAWIFWPKLSAPKLVEVKSLISIPQPSLPPALSEEKHAEDAGRAGNKISPISKAKTFSLKPEEIAKIRSEIKMSLSALYAAEKSFYSEYNRYSTDFNAVGYYPEAQNGELPIRVGFMTPFSPRKLADKEDPRAMDNSVFTHASENGNAYGFAQSASSIGLADQSFACVTGCSAGDNHFELIAVAQFASGQKPEIWTINDKKELKQVQVGAN